MRCPQCNTRNSVAASQCSSCAQLFKRRPLPFQLKFVVGFAAALLLLWGVASALVPQLSDPQLILSRSAKLLAGGPKSKEDALKLSGDFNTAMQGFLKQYGNLTNNELSKKLEAILPASVFEVHIFNLSHTMRLIEVDNGLAATDYLIWSTKDKKTVYGIAGLEVFDDSTVINEPGGSFLVLVGHTAGQSSHRPIVKVLTVMPNDLIDQTSKLVPFVAGDGNAAFTRNKQDISTNLSLASIGQAEGLFDAQQPVPIEDEIIHYNLQWDAGHYWLHTTRGASPLFSLYCVAKCLKSPSQSGIYATTFSTDARKVLRTVQLSQGKSPNFSILSNSTSDRQNAHMASSLFYSLSNPDLLVKVALEKSVDPRTRKGTWSVRSIDLKPSKSSVAQEKIALPNTSPQTLAGSNQSKTAPKQLPQTSESNLQSTHSRSDHNAGSAFHSKKAPIQISSEQNADQSETETAKALSHSNATDLTATVFTNTANTITLRQGPNTESHSLSEIKKGTAIEIIGREKSWYKVRVHGKEGFVYAGLVDYKKPDSYTTATVKESKSISDEKHHPLATPQVGERLVILGGIKNNKYKVQLANGKIGYVDKDALDVKVDAPPLVP